MDKGKNDTVSGIKVLVLIIQTLSFLMGVSTNKFNLYIKYNLKLGANVTRLWKSL